MDQEGDGRVYQEHSSGSIDRGDEREIPPADQIRRWEDDEPLIGVRLLSGDWLRRDSFIAKARKGWRPRCRLGDRVKDCEACNVRVVQYLSTSLVCPSSTTDRPSLHRVKDLGDRYGVTATLTLWASV
jgi:hypothetical protein